MQENCKHAAKFHGLSLKLYFENAGMCSIIAMSLFLQMTPGRKVRNFSGIKSVIFSYSGLLKEGVGSPKSYYI